MRIPDDFEYMGNGDYSECRQLSGSDYAASVGDVAESLQVIRTGRWSVAVTLK
ncbi:MAG: hypothetical protein MJA28_08160 [Gammaproteobacteria bacterium]|nr:hypothetical protein [Gammaproteobacteria bacterium]